MGFRPINNYIHALLEKVQTRGTLLAEAEPPMQKWAVAVKVGEGSPDEAGVTIPLDVQPGDLFFGAMHGAEKLYPEDPDDPNIVISVLDVMCVADAVCRTEHQGIVMINSVKPLGNLIWIEKVQKEKKETALLGVEGSDRPTNVAIVKRVGTGWKTLSGYDIPFHVKEGDRILFKAMDTIKIDGSPLGVDDFTFIRHGDILGVLDDEQS